MWTSTVNRDDLIGIAQGEKPKRLSLRQADFLTDVERFSQSLVAVWAESPEHRFQATPNVLVIPNGETADFFAWATSYLKIKPFTAFVRTMDFDSLSTILPPTEAKPGLLEGLAGLVLTEALTYLEQSATRLSLRACEGTYSFAVAKSLLRVQGHSGIGRTGSNWFRTRRALRNLASKLSPDELQQPWSAIAHALGGTANEVVASESVVRCCEDLISSGEVSENSWRELTEGTDMQRVRDLMQDTREERVLLLERMLQTVMSNRALRRDVGAFLAGYLATMVAPGSLDHWHLLNRVRSSFPTAGLWYGLCAGLTRDNSLDAYGNGLGRLVMRELQRKIDPLERPTCDIALEELENLGPAFKLETLVGATGASVEVEIAPCVSTPFRAPTKEGTGTSQSELHLDFGQPRPPASKPDPRLLERLEDAIDSLEDIRRDMQNNTSSADKPYKRRSQKRRSGL